jgi:fibronectin-binding autotransporter adhesin
MTSIHCHGPLDLAQKLLLMSVLCLSGSVAQANTCNWTGAVSGSWSVAGNWSNCAGNVPVNGDTLQFPEAAGNKLSTHDLAPLTSVAGLSFIGSGSGYTLSGNGLTLNAGGISNSNTTGTNLVNMDLTLGAAQAFTGATASMVLSGSLDLNGHPLQFTWPASAGLIPWNVQSVISGDGTIVASGVGLGTGLQLSGDNSFSGPVNLLSGSTRLEHSHALGLADGSALNGTTIAAQAGLLLGTNLSFGNESLSLAPGIGESGRGILRFLGSNQWGGPVHLTGVGESRIASSSAGSSLNFNEVISGSGGLELGVDPNVSVKLSNPGNSFAGKVTTSAVTPAQGAILRLGGDQAIPGTAPVLLNGNSVFDLNNFDDNIAALSCTSTDQIMLGFGSSLTVGSNNASTTCAGLIFGNVSSAPITVLTKVGSGVLTLSADNPYSGEVDVLGGGLQVNGGLIGDVSTAVFVSSGQNASLFGNGVVGNVVASGTVHGGSESVPGTLFTEFLSLVGIGKLSARLDGIASYDQLNVSNASLSASSTLNVALNFEVAAGTSFMLINNIGGGSITGQFAGLPEGASLMLGDTPLLVSYVGGTGNDLTLTALAPVPLFKDGFE